MSDIKSASVFVNPLVFFFLPSMEGSFIFPNPDLTFPTVTLTARGAAIYKSTGGGNELVLVLDFGSNKTATNGDFIIQFPSADVSNAIIRLGDA